MKLTSPVFNNHGSIPSKYTCDGSNINPPLQISEVPEKTVSLALVVHDLDAANGDFNHWLAYDISTAALTIRENTEPGTPGRNDFNRTAYGGPCPSSGNHRYDFRLYALDTKLDLPAGKTRPELEVAMRGHIIEEVELVGLYQRTG